MKKKHKKSGFKQLYKKVADFRVELAEVIEDNIRTGEFVDYVHLFDSMKLQILIFEKQN